MNNDILHLSVTEFFDKAITDLLKNGNRYRVSNHERTRLRLLLMGMAALLNASRLSGRGVEIWELIERSERQLYCVRGFGRKSMSLWKDLLEQYGLAPGMTFSIQSVSASTPHPSRRYVLPCESAPAITLQQAVDTILSLGYTITLSPKPSDNGTLEQS